MGLGSSPSLPRPKTQEFPPATPSRATLPGRPPRMPVTSRPGHVGVLSSLRRSAPERRLPATWLEGSGDLQQALRPELPDVLRRKPQRGSSRGRRALDAASAHVAKPSSMLWESGSRADKSISGDDAAPSMAHSRGSSMRSASAPPAGAEEAAREKARAVAQLQRLFFEEVSKGQDANEAAANALRRLREGPSGMASASVLAAEATRTDQTSEEDDDEPVRPSDPFREEREAAAEVRTAHTTSSYAFQEEADTESTPEPAPAAIPHRPSPAVPRPTRRRPIVR